MSTDVVPDSRNKTTREYVRPRSRAQEELAQTRHGFKSRLFVWRQDKTLGEKHTGTVLVCDYDTLYSTAAGMWRGCGGTEGR